MGFYGNITNTARTQFQFDKIYPNRYTMDSECLNDGIYAGRFVLIEYDAQVNLDNFIKVQITDNGVFYNPKGQTSWETALTKKLVGAGTIIYTENITQTPEPGSQDYIYYKFYKITSELDLESDEQVEYTLLTDSSNAYTQNYNIDIANYQNGRGYDSTVWQKAYIDGEEKYIMIAELNSVVPTFSVVADAPTMTPMVPHFDVQSTDVYYQLHWQAPWGFRVAESNTSDEETTYKITTYDPNTGISTTTDSAPYPGAIYFNKAGFDIKNSAYVSKEDSITITPTGKSGNKYNKHNSNGDTAEAVDMLEMSIMLPSLGNAISQIWDIIYDYDENNNNKRYRDIEWKDAVTGIDNTDIGGKTYNLSTLAGCINSVHKLMGMVVTSEKPVIEALGGEQAEAEYNKHYIYEENKHYYRLAKIDKFVKEENAPAHSNSGTYEYKYIELEGLGNNLSTIFGCILEIKELLGTDLEKNTGEKTYDRNTIIGALNSLNEIIDLFAPLTSSQLLIYNDDKKIKTANCITNQAMTYENWGKKETVSVAEAKNFVTVDVNGQNNSITIKHEFNGITDTTTVSDKNIGGSGGGINNNTDDTLQLYSPIVDNMGHVVGRNVETVTLPSGYKNITVGEDSSVITDVNHLKGTQTANITKDTITFKPSNKWIKMQGDGDKTVSISHEVHSFIGGEPNTEYGLVADKTVQQLDDNNDKFEVPAFEFDEAGHITGASTHTVTVPTNFKTIKISNGRSLADIDNSLIANADIEAKTLTDNLTMDAGNHWIILNGNASDKKVTIYHAAAGDTTTELAIKNSSPNFGGTFEIADFSYDKTGHITGSAARTITIPSIALNEPDYIEDTSIVTSLSLDVSNGSFTQNIKNIGELKITGYNAGEVANDLSETDTINSAFGKLENRIKAEEAARNELDFIGIAEEGKYISAVSQTNGKISTTLESLPDYSSYWDKITELENTIAQMQNTITDLTSRIEQLENSTEPTE